MAKKVKSTNTSVVSKSMLRVERADMHDLALLGIQRGGEIINTDSYCLKIEGERGSGKTSFLLEEVAAAADKYGEDRVLCCIIDMDNGTRRIFSREDIVPIETRKCFMRKVVDHFEDVYTYLEVFADLLAKHAKEYPDNAARWLVLENEGAFYLSCRDHYSTEVHGMPERDLMKARMAQARSETKYNPTTGKMEAKKMLPTYAEGRRAAYSVINRNYKDFFVHALLLADQFSCNFIFTTLAEKKTVFQDDKATDKTFMAVQGKPDKCDQYPDFILQLFTEGEDEKTKFMMRCTKNRDGQRFRMDNNGPELFWDFLGAQRQDAIKRKNMSRQPRKSSKKHGKPATKKPATTAKKEAAPAVKSKAEPKKTKMKTKPDAEGDIDVDF